MTAQSRFLANGVVFGGKVSHKALIPAFHLFANLHSPSSYCKPQSKEEIRRELQAFSQKAPILDLVNHNMRAPRSRPMFIWMGIPQKRQLDLAIGHIRLFAYFDIEAFLKCVTDSGINVSKISRKEAEKIKEFSPAIPGFPNVYGFEVGLPNGNVHMLLNGFFSRAFFYLTKPSSLLMLIKRWDEQDLKMFKTHFGEDSTNSVKSN